MPSAPEIPVVSEQTQSNQGLALDILLADPYPHGMGEGGFGARDEKCHRSRSAACRGILFGSLSAGLIVSSGALNVCFTDGDDPYRQRARRMLLGTVLVGLAVLIGTLSGHDPMISIAITASGPSPRE